MNPFYIWLDELRNKSRKEKEEEKQKKQQLDNDSPIFRCKSKTNLEACKQKLITTQELEDEINKILEEENLETSSSL